MKKKLFVIILALFVAQSAYLIAADTSETEYDEDLYGPEAPVIWDKPVRGVIFEHKIHTMEIGLDCDSCHDEIFEMESGAAQENDDFNMEAMYDGLYCGACHDGGDAFAANTRCTTCHIGVRGVERLSGKNDAQGH
jgi:c(7)-type cytochrome triheme protein